jgi:pyruvate ferredoxin oxidoreductase alpha subunit
MVKEKIDFVTGNDAAAYAVKVCKPDVIPAYPITPQSPVTEKISEYVADGELDSEYVEVDGEHSCLAVARGAGQMGARVFTATCGPGLMYAHENMQQVAVDRTPLVMAVPNRSHIGLYPDLTDTMPESQSGIIMLFCESPQEVLDTIIQAYKICEDHRVLLPGFVCYDGYVTSHTGSTIYLPDQEEVDKFLPPYEPYLGRVDTSKPMTRQWRSAPLLKMDLELAMDNARSIIKEVNEEFYKQFGRRYGNGLIDKIELDDAEVALLTHHTLTGTAREVVKRLRAKGEKIGIVKLKSYRPFPHEDLADALKGVKVVAVVERHSTPGLGVGMLCGDLQSSLYDLAERPLVLDGALGLGGTDVTLPEITYVANAALEASKTGVVKKKVIWAPEIK